MRRLNQFIDRYLDGSRPMELMDWVLVLFLTFLLGMLVTTEVNAQTTREIESVVVEAARAHGIDPKLALAIAEVESQMNPRAVGSVGEVGLFQLRPEFHRVERGNLRMNVNTAMRYLATLKQTCRGYGEAFFVCYNYGPSRKLKHPKLFPYYRKVKLAMSRRANHANANHVALAD